MPWIRGRFYVDFASLRDAEIDRARAAWSNSGRYMGRGFQTRNDYFVDRIAQLQMDIQWLVNAAVRANNNRARQRLFRKAHFVRLEKRAVEAAQRHYYRWELMQSVGPYSAPPPQ